MLLTNIILHGRVQDIGFRAFVKNVADEMKLTGEVWNNYDKTLEIKVYTKDKKTFDEFLEKIKDGCSTPSSPYWRKAAPAPVSLASTARIN